MLDSIFLGIPGQVLPTIFAGIFGLVIGSFLNVVIHRLPIMMRREWDNSIATDGDNREEAIKLGSPIRTVSYQSDVPLPYKDRYNIMVPRSACPHCGHQITALENIPVVSYLALRGKCIECKAPISMRYPIVELLTGLLSAFLIWHFGSGTAGLGTLAFAYLLIAMTFIDADTQFLPDLLTLPLLWCGLLINLHATFTSLQDAVLGAVAGYLVLWLVNGIYKLLRQRDGMGHGDFKLLAALGAWLGWKLLPVIILLSSLVGAVVGISLIVLSRHGRHNPIPFGPYLAGAGLLALLYGHDLMQAYLGSLA